MSTSKEEEFKQVIHFVAGEICKEQEEETGIAFSKQSVASLAEISYKQFLLFAEDLEMFTKHARRKRVSPEDVLMLVRKTPVLHDHLMKIKNDNK